MSFSLTVMDYLLIAFIVALVVYIHHELKELKKIQGLHFVTFPKKPLKILSVVAGHDLNMEEIEKSLYSTDISYNLLPFQAVNQDSLLAELEKDVTVFELSSHGLNGSFRLGNASIPISWLKTALLQCHDLEAVLLLYCNSYIDLEMISGSAFFAVGLVGDVTDASCVTFARHFYFFLDRHYDYKEAFERARLHLPVEDFPKFIFKDGRSD